MLSRNGSIFRSRWYQEKSIRNIDLQLQAKINISEPQNIDPNQYAMLRARAAAPSSTRVASTS
jgi:hypothetical protein